MVLVQEKHYTYSDYLKWDDDNRYELIDGKPYMMSPSPGRTHQETAGELYKQLAVFLTGKPCRVYIAPFDVRLNMNDADDTVVQPDVFVVCDKQKLNDKGCNGAPDFIAEILSPSTIRHDRITKFNKYLQAGVREYWIIDPDIKAMSAHVLKDGQYMTNVYVETDIVPVHVLEGCRINLQDLFSFDLNR